jgi:hypothetical protein
MPCTDMHEREEMQMGGNRVLLGNLHGSQDAGFPLRRFEFLSVNVKNEIG